MKFITILLSFSYPITTSAYQNLITRRNLITTSNLLSTMSMFNNNINNINSNTNNNNNNNRDDNKDNTNENQEKNFIGGIKDIEKNNDVYFYSEINDETLFRLNSNLLYLNHNLEANQEINLHIQSQGGSLLPSFSTVDLIRTSDIPINTYIEGYAASAATLISVVGAKRFITKNSVMLIHQLKMGTENSKFNEIQDYFSNAETLMEIVKNIYLENTNIDKPLLESLLDKDLWLNSTTCKNYGLIDIII